MATGNSKIFGIFTPEAWVKWIQIDDPIFLNGLKPPIPSGRSTNLGGFLLIILWPTKMYTQRNKDQAASAVFLFLGVLEVFSGGENPRVFKENCERHLWWDNSSWHIMVQFYSKKWRTLWDKGRTHEKVPLVRFQSQIFPGKLLGFFCGQNETTPRNDPNNAGIGDLWQSSLYI